MSMSTEKGRAVGEILKYVLANFGRLQAIDYVLICAVVALFAFAVFVALRGVYRSRFEAQAELLTIREDTITSLARQLTATKSASGEGARGGISC